MEVIHGKRKQKEIHIEAERGRHRRLREVTKNVASAANFASLAFSH
jgi:hypothetical protein